MTSRSRRSPTAARASPRGRSFFASRASRADGHDFAPDAVRRGAVALVCERPLGLGVPEVVVDGRPGGDGAAGRAFYGNPTRELRVVGVTGTNGKTTTAFLVRHILERPGIQTGLLGTVGSVVGGRERGGRAHDARGDRPPAHLPRDARRRRRGLRDGGLLARARAPPRRRDRLRLRRLHQPDAGPPRLPRRRSRSYFGAKRRLFAPDRARVAGAVVNLDDPCGRASRRSSRRGPRASSPSGSTATPTTARRDVSSSARGCELHLRRARRQRARSRCRCPGCSTSRTRSARWRPRARSACRSTTPRPRCARRRACRDASSRSTRARASACSSTTRTRRTRSRTCSRRAASCSGRRAAGGSYACSAQAATATARSGR